MRCWAGLLGCRHRACTALLNATAVTAAVVAFLRCRGDDEMAACGQLGDVGLTFRPPPILEAPERFRHLLLPAPVPAAAC